LKFIKIYRTIILCAVLYEYGTWSHIIRKNRVFENRALRRISGHKMEVVMGSWRQLLNEELPSFVPITKKYWDD
jgi:hypothetical protein